MSAATIVRRADYRIERHRDEIVRYPTNFCVYEMDGPTFENGLPRATLSVEVYSPRKAYGGGVEGARVGWPTTSDQRPLVARALAEALVLAAAEADRLDEAAYLMSPGAPTRALDADFRATEIREGALVFLVDDQVNICEGTPATWKVVDEYGRSALVPAGSPEKATRR